MYERFNELQNSLDLREVVDERGDGEQSRQALLKHPYWQRVESA